MAGFNFGKIGSIISKVCDTDYVDIYRALPDMSERQLVHSNQLCNIQLQNADNPNPLAVDVVPVVTSVKIHFPIEADIQNNDYLIARKTDAEGNTLSIYRGVCGYPVVEQARQSVVLEMNTAEAPGKSNAPRDEWVM